MLDGIHRNRTARDDRSKSMIGVMEILEVTCTSSKFGKQHLLKIRSCDVGARSYVRTSVTEMVLAPAEAGASFPCGR